jgi:hypothetical protein
VGRDVDEDELIEHWTLVGEELTQLAGKRGPTRLAFGLSLKFHQRHGRFPRGRAELPDDVVEFVAKAVGVPAVELFAYEWDGAPASTTAPRSVGSPVSASAESPTRRR